MKTILYIGNQLKRHGFTPTSIDTLGPVLEQKYQVIYASDQQNPFLRLLDMCARILKYRRLAKPVLIDTYSTSAFYFALVCGLLCKLLKLPYIPTLHGGNLPQRLQQSPRLSQLLFARSAANIAPSGFLAKAFVQAGYSVQIIPNSIELDIYTFQERSACRPRLLWVRSFDQVYQPQMAIQVLAQLKNHYPDAVLCMVGPDKDGTLADCRQLAVELTVEASIQFTGRLPKTDWINKSIDYDIFINTTNFDNTPVSVIEAMALGLPVVSTNPGGIPYLIEHERNGLLVNCKDEASMTEAILRLMKEPELARNLSQNGRETAAAFDAKRVLSQWTELIDRVACS